MQKNSTTTEDIVIVGCGAAGIGLLYGLLVPFDTASSCSSSSTSASSPQKKPNFTIAVIERGGGGGGGGDECDNDHDGGNNSTSASATRKDPKQWFKASHPILSNEKNTDAIIYDSSPQCGLKNRIITIPTGKCLGGGTNINATLVTRPSEDDFVDWPDIWKETKGNQSQSTTQHGKKSTCRIMTAIETIENAMGTNLNHGTLCREHSSGLPSDYQLHSNNGEYTRIQGIEDLNNVKLLSFNYSVKKNKGHTTFKKQEQYGLDYERVNAYEALIKPLLQRNPILREVVHFYTHTQVERLLIEKTKLSSSHEFIVKGVECRHTYFNTKQMMKDNHNEYFNIMAKQKVILCAGAILSPALLLISGIGNPNNLVKEGIKPLLPSFTTWDGVGQNFRDHFVVTKALFIPRNFWSTTKSINAIRGYTALDIEDGNDPTSITSTSTSRVYIKIIDGTTSSFILPHVVSSFFHRQYDCTIIDFGFTSLVIPVLNHLLKIVFYILYIIMSFLFNLHPLKCFLSHHTINVLLCLLNPESTGTVTIKRKMNKTISKKSLPLKQYEIPNRLSDFNIIINPGYLTKRIDSIRIEKSWYMMNQLTKQWFSSSNSNCYEILPGLAYQIMYGKKNYIHHYAMDFGLPYFHFSGSVKMKKKDDYDNDDWSLSSSTSSYVVNEMLNVKNVMNLHVCDASIFPGNISGPTALTCLGLGYVAASLIVSTS